MVATMMVAGISHSARIHGDGRTGEGACSTAKMRSRERHNRNEAMGRCSVRVGKVGGKQYIVLAGVGVIVAYALVD